MESIRRIFNKLLAFLFSFSPFFASLLDFPAFSTLLVSSSRPFLFAPLFAENFPRFVAEPRRGACRAFFVFLFRANVVDPSVSDNTRKSNRSNGQILTGLPCARSRISVSPARFNLSSSARSVSHVSARAVKSGNVHACYRRCKFANVVEKTCSLTRGRATPRWNDFSSL